MIRLILLRGDRVGKKEKEDNCKKCYYRSFALRALLTRFMAPRPVLIPKTAKILLIEERLKAVHAGFPCFVNGAVNCPVFYF